jgi:membrane-bound ClpP family serine protease
MNSSPKRVALLAVALGAGMICAVFLPPQFMVGISGCIIIVIGLAFLKC